MSIVQLPILRDRMDPRVILGPLHPLKLSVTETADPVGSAQMDLPMDEAVENGQFVELFSLSGSLGMYRVINIARNYTRGGTVSVRLEHAIGTLGNTFIHEAIKFEGATMYAVFWHLLSLQTKAYWQIWDGGAQDSTNPDIAFLLSRTDPTEFGTGTDLLAAFLNGMAYLYGVDMQLEYDFSVFPWRVLPVRVDKTVKAEARLSRNVETVKIQYDYTAMTTRLYATGGYDDSGEQIVLPGDGYIDADTVGRFGIIESQWQDGTAATQEKLLESARAQLEKVKNPVITITMDGYDLSRSTGESLDHFRPGDYLQTVIPADQIALPLRIISVAHPDLLREPERVTLTIGTPDKRKVTLSRKQQPSSGGGGGGGGGGGTQAYTQTHTHAVYMPFNGTIHEYAIWTATVDSRFVSISSATITIRPYDTGTYLFDVNDGAAQRATGNKTITLSGVTAGATEKVRFRSSWTKKGITFNVTLTVKGRISTT